MNLLDSGGAAEAEAPRALHIGWIPEGPEGVRITLELMRQLVITYRADPVIRQFAERLIAHVPPKDFAGEARAIHDWVRDNIRYTRDPNEVEWLKTPPLLLTDRAGDCDDMSALTATLLEAVGHPTRFVAAAFDEEAFSHVFVETKVGTQWPAVWTASDTTEPVALGWVPPGIRGRLGTRHV